MGFGEEGGDGGGGEGLGEHKVAVLIEACELLFCESLGGRGRGGGA